MELDLYLLQLEDEAQKAIDHYAFELSKLSTGRANPQIIRGIKVNYYDTLTPLEELASVSVPEPQQLLIKPYDASVVNELCKVIQNSNLGVSPINEGHQVRLSFPPLTTDRRKEMIKNIAKFTENAKVGVRNARQNVNKAIKDDEDLSEDVERRFLEEVQKVVDKKIERINEMTQAKEKELMSL
ncbi:ribosome recycling factor [Mycoplasma sp. Mirounga ES2805-ORL]|uniref:ribosome recycling factor n=1 Tax=Mycoplasma sp. Mirounga ES2805-ORL TaxID=754514 RepID=UPI00197C1AD1|nr:ribosome recycling factor [Mycoplasma sp. Mirounga ES2805-ORL]QSF13658.1 ribosome recycling factor [Mycoplasma sp. Mirounga ES2805-ORL]